ncbi:NAD-dependent epimerase/dehydratase family protein [Flavobacteriaceae bacterium]|nr:NAD-dependent epimerase/dehydratase family protein [Flavobacteriaceae bacterium]
MILVTGGTGLVGCHLLYSLVNENKKVRALHRKNSKTDSVRKVFSYYSKDYKKLFDKIEWIEGDINDITSLDVAFQNISEIYHCAAFISFSNQDFNAMKKINVEGTANMVNTAIDNKVDKFCYVSTIAAIGERKNMLIDEECEWKENNNPYSKTKHDAELEVWRGISEGLNAVIVNPGVIIGSGYWKRGSGAFITQISRGMNYFPPGKTGFICVKDVVKIMRELMNKNIFSERFLLVAENWTQKDFIYSVCNYLNLKSPLKKASKSIMILGLILDAARSFFLNKRRRLSSAIIKSSHSKNEYSNKKISSVLNYKFKMVEKSIKVTCENFKLN